MPEYSSFLLLDRYSNNLQNWTNRYVRSHQPYDLLTKLFIYNPDKRITAKDTLDHKWFQDEPKPNRKSVEPIHCFLSLLMHCFTSAFFTLPVNQVPPRRRISHDEAPTMVTVPNTQSQSQSHSLMNANGNSRSASGTGFGMPLARLGGASGTTGTRKKQRLG